MNRGIMEDEIDFSQIKFTGEPQTANADPKPKSTRRPGRPSSESKLTDVRSEIGQLIKFTAFPVKMRDTHEDGSSCADMLIYYDEKKKKTELTQEGGNLADALSAIVIDSPFLMKMLQSGDLFGKWGGLAMALYPIAMAVYENHGQGRFNRDITESAVA